MTDTYLEVGYINFDEVIVHGMIAGRDGIRKVLNEAEKNALYEFNAQQEAARQAFLLQMVNA